MTRKVIVGHQLALAGVPSDRVGDAIADLDQRLKLTTSLGFADPAAPSADAGLAGA